MWFVVVSVEWKEIPIFHYPPVDCVIKFMARIKLNLKASTYFCIYLLVLNIRMAYCCFAILESLWNYYYYYYYFVCMNVWPSIDFGVVFRSCHNCSSKMFMVLLLLLLLSVVCFSFTLIHSHSNSIRCHCSLLSIFNLHCDLKRRERKKKNNIKKYVHTLTFKVLLLPLLLLLVWQTLFFSSPSDSWILTMDFDFHTNNFD